MWDNISFLFPVLLKGKLNYGTIPRGDRGTLCPSYDLSFSVFLLKILLFREKDTLSIAVPKRIANCWLGFGFSSCKQTRHDGTPARCYFLGFLLLRKHAAFSIVQNKGKKNQITWVWLLFWPPLLAIWGRMFSDCWFLALLSTTWTTGGSSWGKVPMPGPNFCRRTAFSNVICSETLPQL